MSYFSDLTEVSISKTSRQTSRHVNDRTFAVFHTHVELKAFTESPLTSSNLPISTLSVYLSRARVGQ